MAAGALAILGDFLNAHPPPPRFGEMINVPAVKLPNPGGAPYRDAAGRFWLVNLKPGEGAPGAAHGFGRPSDAGGLLALYERCPFRGCRVIWRPDFIFLDYTSWFRCPCCGSTFTKAGLRVIGPAPRSLDTFPVARLPLGGISVNTGRILLGGRDDPQRAQPAS
jgi:cytochrome b6-f complex iron-sulfur subunit